MRLALLLNPNKINAIVAQATPANSGNASFASLLEDKTKSSVVPTISDTLAVIGKPTDMPSLSTARTAVCKRKLNQKDHFRENLNETNLLKIFPILKTTPAKQDHLTAVPSCMIVFAKDGKKSAPPSVAPHNKAVRKSPIA